MWSRQQKNPRGPPLTMWIILCDSDRREWVKWWSWQGKYPPQCIYMVRFQLGRPFPAIRIVYLLISGHKNFPGPWCIMGRTGSLSWSTTVYCVHCAALEFDTMWLSPSDLIFMLWCDIVVIFHNSKLMILGLWLTFYKLQRKFIGLNGDNRRSGIKGAQGGPSPRKRSNQRHHKLRIMLSFLGKPFPWTAIECGSSSGPISPSWINVAQEPFSLIDKIQLTGPPQPN